SPHLHSGSDALEGKRVLHWQAADGLGLILLDPQLAQLAQKRIIVSFWGRAEGMEPYLAVTYGNTADIAQNGEGAWRRIPPIRTGRETDDGWVEYSTGAIDGSILDRPIHDLILSARVPTAADTGLLLNDPALHPSDAISVDAVEIV